MKILFNDVVQESDAPLSLKSAALADRYSYAGAFTITFDTPRYIDSVGIGFTDASTFRLAFVVDDGTIVNNMAAATADNQFQNNYVSGGVYSKEHTQVLSDDFDASKMSAGEDVYHFENGLYLLKPTFARAVTVTCNGTYIGRLAFGRAVDLPTAIAKEPGFAHTADARRTLAGQMIEGAGGYMFRTVGLDTRYKISGAAIDEIKEAFNKQIGIGFPWFIFFDTEHKRLPWIRMYAIDRDYNNIVLQGGINRYLFSRRFDLEECF